MFIQVNTTFLVKVAGVMLFCRKTETQDHFCMTHRPGQSIVYVE